MTQSEHSICKNSKTYNCDVCNSILKLYTNPSYISDIRIWLEKQIKILNLRLKPKTKSRKTPEITDYKDSSDKNLIKDYKERLTKNQTILDSLNQKDSTLSQSYVSELSKLLELLIETDKLDSKFNIERRSLKSHLIRMVDAKLLVKSETGRNKFYTLSEKKQLDTEQINLKLIEFYFHSIDNEDDDIKSDLSIRSDRKSIKGQFPRFLTENQEFDTTSITENMDQIHSIIRSFTLSNKLILQHSRCITCHKKIEDNQSVFLISNFVVEIENMPFFSDYMADQIGQDQGSYYVFEYDLYVGYLQNRSYQLPQKWKIINGVTSKRLEELTSIVYNECDLDDAGVSYSKFGHIRSRLTGFQHRHCYNPTNIYRVEKALHHINNLVEIGDKALFNYHLDLIMSSISSDNYCPNCLFPLVLAPFINTSEEKIDHDDVDLILTKKMSLSSKHRLKFCEYSEEEVNIEDLLRNVDEVMDHYDPDDLLIVDLVTFISRRITFASDVIKVGNDLYHPWCLNSINIKETSKQTGFDD